MADLKLAFEDIKDDEALDQFVVDSVNWPFPLAVDRHFRWLAREAKIAVAKDMIVKQGMVPITVRNLDGDDLRLASRHWNQTVAVTENTWQDSAVAAATTRSNVAIGIFGVVDIGTVQSVSGIRIQAAGSRQVQWDLQPGFNPFGPRGDNPDMNRFYLADSVLLIGEEKGVTVQYYIRGATAINVQPAELPLIGVIAELEAAGAGLSSVGPTLE